MIDISFFDNPYYQISGIESSVIRLKSFSVDYCKELRFRYDQARKIYPFSYIESKPFTLSIPLAAFPLRATISLISDHINPRSNETSYWRGVHDHPLGTIELSDIFKGELGKNFFAVPEIQFNCERIAYNLNSYEQSNIDITHPIIISYYDPSPSHTVSDIRFCKITLENPLNRYMKQLIFSPYKARQRIEPHQEDTFQGGDNNHFTLRFPLNAFPIQAKISFRRRIDREDLPQDPLGTIELSDIYKMKDDKIIFAVPEIQFRPNQIYRNLKKL